ncbi:MAG: hypothetical protein OXH37_08530, partial [Gammaproteobacteria bacterium]|nr:hypothetical protein [Gammaproteobacteria bacterium]
MWIPGRSARRALLFAAALAALAFAPAWSGQQGHCATGLFILRADFPGARLGPCRMIGPRALEVRIEPEDEPINPSPRYGFHA